MENDEERKTRKAKLTMAGGILLLILLVGLILISNMAREKHNTEEGVVQDKGESSVSTEEQEKSSSGEAVIKKMEMETDKADGRTQKKETPEEKYPRIKKEKDGREYTAYAKKEKWDSMTEEEKAEMTEQLIPVLQDKNKTIDRICTSKSRPELEPYSYALATFLKTYCQEQEIQAHTGTFLAYAGWISRDEEQIYIELDDPDQTILLATAELQGRFWKFEQVSGTREEVLKWAKENEEYADDIPAKTAESKTKTE